MATRSNIALKLDNGQYMQAYCHYDGYPEHMTPALAHFTTQEQVAELVSKDIRCISSETGVYEHFSDAEDSFIQDRPSLDEEYLYVFEEDRWWILNHRLERTPLHTERVSVDELVLKGVAVAKQDSSFPA